MNVVENFFNRFRLFFALASMLTIIYLRETLTLLHFKYVEGSKERNSFLLILFSSFFSSYSFGTLARNQNPAVFHGWRAYCNSFSTHRRGIEVRQRSWNLFRTVWESLSCLVLIVHPSYPILIPPPPSPFAPLCRSFVSLFSFLRNILSSSHFLSSPLPFFSLIFSIFPSFSLSPVGVGFTYSGA